MHRRVVLGRQPFGVLLDRGDVGAGFDERDRNAHHVVAALAGVLPLVGRLHAVRPFEGVAPSVGGAGRKGTARLHDPCAVRVVERPGDTVLAGERRPCRQAEAVADHAGRRMAFGTGLHQGSEKGVGHCSTPGSRVIASAEPAAAPLPRVAAGAWAAAGGFAGVASCPSGHAFASLWHSPGERRAGCAAGRSGSARGTVCAFDVALRGRRSSTEQVPGVARVTVRATHRRPGKPEVCVLRPLNPKKMLSPTPCRARSSESRATGRSAASESKRPVTAPLPHQ